MASKQRPRSAVKQKTLKPIVDLGIVIPDMDISSITNIDVDSESDVDESALELELQALLSGASTKPSRPKNKVAPGIFDVEKMAAECLKDPVEDDDENDDSLLNDPELLKELMENLENSPTDEERNETMILPEEKQVEESNKSVSQTSVNIVSLLEERLQLYNNALVAAKASGDSSKARRFDRGLKTIKSLLKSARSGNIINEEDIPPAVSIPKVPKVFKEPEKLPEPLVPSLIPSSHVEKNSEIENTSSDIKVPFENDDYKMLLSRRDQYQNAALQAKKAGDKATALEHFKISKGFNVLIEAMQNGEPVDLRNVPPPPPNIYIASDMISSKKKEDELQISSPSLMETAALSAADEPEDPSMFLAPPPPSTVLEALEQRLEKYVTTKATADTEGNSSKSRRLQRIIKSYEKAIKDYKAGKPVNFEELPTPPGFAPIPISSQSNMTSTVDVKTTPESTEKPKAPSVAPKRVAPQDPQKVPSKNSQNTGPKPKLTRTNTSTVEKQLEFLLERQKLFRQAALESKKQGDIQQAKEYLRMSKGFDSMIEATKCGLPIDASSIPTPPQLQTDFVVVEAFDSVPPIEGTDPDEILNTLESDLIHQIEVCTKNKDHFLKLGDVSSASKFEKLALESKKDLSVIRNLQKTGASSPKFHYETRLFSIVQCNPDLSDSELEVVVERGINLPGKPDDLDSYVRLEFPIPNDAPQKARSHIIKDTNNPTFQEKFKFEINRKSRAQLRQFKRQALKLEVWSKGGFLRADTLLGVASVKLVDLESKCIIHDCFDLMDGRKMCGGKLEVKVRIRDPLLVKQVEEVKEKWLVIEN